jgi:hypothetical protein
MKERSGTAESAAFAAVVRNRHWRAPDAQVALAEWGRSGLELEEFTRRHGLDPRRLRRWQARLDQEGAPLRFHPVEFRLDPEPSDERERESGDGGVRLVLRGGRHVAVGRGFDEELLAQLVKVVESWSC